jgi:hypothetical protein
MAPLLWPNIPRAAIISAEAPQRGREIGPYRGTTMSSRWLFRENPVVPGNRYGVMTFLRVVIAL